MLFHLDMSLLADLKPRGVVVNMIPGLAANILFMCVRHADYLNDGAKLKSLMNAVINGIKKVITVSYVLIAAHKVLSCVQNDR